MKIIAIAVFLSLFAFGGKALASCPRLAPAPDSQWNCIDYGSKTGFYSITAGNVLGPDSTVALSAPLQIGLFGESLSVYGVNKNLSGNSPYAAMRAGWTPGEVGKDCYWNLPKGGTYYSFCYGNEHLLVVFFPNGWQFVTQ